LRRAARPGLQVFEEREALAHRPHPEPGVQDQQQRPADVHQGSNGEHGVDRHDASEPQLDQHLDEVDGAPGSRDGAHHRSERGVAPKAVPGLGPRSVVTGHEGADEEEYQRLA